MGIHTFFTWVIRFFRTVLAFSVSFPAFSTEKNDVESGVSKSSGIVEAEIACSLETSGTAEPNEPPFSSYFVSGRKPSRNISTVRPVKSRIVDAVLRNVRDQSSNVLKPVVITPSSYLHTPYTAKVEIFPGPTPASRASISSALKVLKTSGGRVVKLVRTQNFLLDAGPPPRASDPPRSGHSIEDIIDLFPSPPAHDSPKEPDSELDNYPRNSEPPSAVHSSGIREHRSSISTSGSLSSVSSGNTAATSPPTTPELAQMTRMTSVTNRAMVEIPTEGCQPSLVEPAVEGVDHEATTVSVQTNLSSGNNAHTNLVSVITPYLDSSASDSETSPGAITQADGELVRKDTFSDVYIANSGWRRSVKHFFYAFREATREDQDLRNIVYRDSCFSGQNSGFTARQCLDFSTPSNFTDRVQGASSSPAEASRTFTSCSENLAKPKSAGGITPMASLLRPFGSSSRLGPGMDFAGFKIIAQSTNQPQRNADYFRWPRRSGSVSK